MALMKRNETETETETEIEIETKNGLKTPKTSQETAPTPDTDKKEVAVKSRTETVIQNQGFWLINDSLREAVATAQYGDFPQIVATAGQFFEAGDKGTSFGKVIAFKPILARVKMVCSPNSNDEESKEYFAALYEGETTFDGRSIEECLEDARAAGYEKADIKEYVDLYVLVTASEEGNLAGEVAVFQLSPTSKIEWRRFSKRLETKAAFGQLASMEEKTFRAVAAPGRTKQGKSYTKFTFELA